MGTRLRIRGGKHSNSCPYVVAAHWPLAGDGKWDYAAVKLTVQQW